MTSVDRQADRRVLHSVGRAPARPAAAERGRPPAGARLLADRLAAVADAHPPQRLRAGREAGDGLDLLPELRPAYPDYPRRPLSGADDPRSAAARLRAATAGPDAAT